MNLNFLSKIFSILKLKPQKIEPLQGDGSNRKFFRVFLKKDTFILILPQKGEYGLKEAKVYFNLGSFFKKNQIPVPEIKFYDPETGILLVEDLGNSRLYDLKKKKTAYYYQALEHLFSLQRLKEIFPIEETLETPFYDFEFLWEREIKYFLEWYVKKYKKINLKEEIIFEFQSWIKNKIKFNHLVVMHRDFQSKNLMIKKGKVYIIDFQGARLGPPAYDLASLLKDPYVELKKEKELLNYYLNLTNYDKESFEKEFQILSFIRILQTLGAFSKLSLKEKKIWFKDFIPSGERKLIRIIKNFEKREGKTTLPFLLLFFLRFF